MVEEQKVVVQEERVDRVAHRKAQVRVVVGRTSKKETMVKNLEVMRIMEKMKMINNRIPYQLKGILKESTNKREIRKLKHKRSSL